MYLIDTLRRDRHYVVRGGKQRLGLSLEGFSCCIISDEIGKVENEDAFTSDVCRPSGGRFDPVPNSPPS